MSTVSGHWPLWLLLAALCACSDAMIESGPGTGEPTDEDSLVLPDDDLDLIEKLINGQFTFERPETGWITSNGSACTATLIRDNVLITAAHCVGYNTADYQGRQVGNFTVHLDANRNETYGFDAYRSFGRQPGADDVALIRLTQRVPANVATPAAIAERRPNAGEGATIFGYGCGNRNQNDGRSGRKQKLPITFGQSNNLCPGDSGGPVYMGADGSGGLFDINSAYLLPNNGDIFGDAVRFKAQIDAQAQTWGGQGQQNPNDPPNNDPPNNNNPPGNGAGLSCGETLSCRVDQCGLQGDQCLQDCLNRAAPNSLRLWEAIRNCAQQSGCQNYSCTQQACAAQISACNDDQVAPPDPDPDPGPGDNGGGGDGECKVLMDCGTQCAGDSECFRGCWDDASRASQDAYRAYSSCYTEHNCRDGQCARQNCWDEYTACAGEPEEPPAGNGDNGGEALDCEGITRCAHSCERGDQACYRGCYFDGSRASQQTYDAYALCAQQAQCLDVSCALRECADKYGACFGGLPEDPQGPQNCGEMFDCYSGCRGDRPCFTECFRTGTRDSRDQYRALSNCSRGAGCDTYSCVQASCADELATCR